MQHIYTTEEANRVGEARVGFSGRLLTDRQFEDFMAVTGVIERRILETGSFVDTLNDYSNALARTERFDAVKADTIIRDLFKARTGMTMNEMREQLMEREAALFDREANPAEQERQKAYQAAMEAGAMVQTGDKLTFHRALNFEAVNLAQDLDITHVGAKKLIEQSFEETEGRPLKEWGQELDDKYYRPQIEAMKRGNKRERTQSRARQPSYS